MDYTDVLRLPCAQEFRLPKSAGEDNWKSRMDFCNKMTVAIETHGSGDRLPKDFTTQIEPYLNNILDCAASERTQLSNSACKLLAALPKVLGRDIHPHLDRILPVLIKLCANTKQVTVKVAAAAVANIVQYSTYSPRLLWHVCQVFEDKTSGPKQNGTAWLITIMKEYHRSMNIQKDSEMICRAISHGLEDADVQVRTSSRATYWTYSRLDPDGAAAIMERLNQHARTALQNDPHNPEKKAASTKPQPPRPKSALADVRKEHAKKKRAEEEAAQKQRQAFKTSTASHDGIESQEPRKDKPKKEERGFKPEQTAATPALDDRKLKDTPAMPRKDVPRAHKKALSQDDEVVTKPSATSRLLSAPVRRPRINVTPMNNTNTNQHTATSRPPSRTGQAAQPKETHKESRPTSSSSSKSASVANFTGTVVRRPATSPSSKSASTVSCIAARANIVSSPKLKANVSPPTRGTNQSDGASNVKSTVSNSTSNDRWPAGWAASQTFTSEEGSLAQSVASDSGKPVAITGSGPLAQTTLSAQNKPFENMLNAPVSQPNAPYVPDGKENTAISASDAKSVVPIAMPRPESPRKKAHDHRIKQDLLDFGETVAEPINAHGLTPAPGDETTLYHQIPKALKGDLEAYGNRTAKHPIGERAFLEGDVPLDHPIYNQGHPHYAYPEPQVSPPGKRQPGYIDLKSARRFLAKVLEAPWPVTANVLMSRKLKSILEQHPDLINDEDTFDRLFTGLHNAIATQDDIHQHHAEKLQPAASPNHPYTRQLCLQMTIPLLRDYRAWSSKFRSPWIKSMIWYRCTLPPDPKDRRSEFCIRNIQQAINSCNRPLDFISSVIEAIKIGEDTILIANKADEKEALQRRLKKRVPGLPSSVDTAKSFTTESESPNSFDTHGSHNPWSARSHWKYAGETDFVVQGEFKQTEASEMMVDYLRTAINEGNIQTAEHESVGRQLPLLLETGLSTLTYILERGIKADWNLEEKQEKDLCKLAKHCLESYDYLVKMSVIPFVKALYEIMGADEDKFFEYFPDESMRNLLEYYLFETRARVDTGFSVGIL